MRVISFIVGLVRQFPFQFLTNTLLLVAVGLVDVLSIVTLVPVVDVMIGLESERTSPVTHALTGMMESAGFDVTLWSLLAVFVVLNVVKSGFLIGSGYLILRTKYAVIRALMLGTFEDFFNARWRFFSSTKQGTLLNTFLRELTVVSEAFGGMALIAAHSIQLVFYLAVPLYLSWQVTLVSLLAALMCAWPFLLFGKVSYRLGQANTTTANWMGTILQESFGSAKVILGFGNQHKSRDALGDAFDVHRRAAIRSQTLRQAIPQAYYPLGLVVLVSALLLARGSAVPLSETAVILYALLRMIPTIGGILGAKNSVDNFLPSYEQIVTLRRQAKQLEQRTGTRRFAGFEEIATTSLSFAHPGSEPTLTDVTIRIPKGKMIAVVGESGAGKSTLIDLIMGFHEPTTGRITVDGVPLQEFDIHSYRRRIGYVPQESLLFHMTIRDNLRWAHETATDREIRWACQQANAEEFIHAFPEGYETLVGDRGIRLSGGQVQRIALARAILRTPDLLILDEATSSLDTTSERLIQQAMERIAKGTTVIVIAHRLSTIVNADYIYVLKKGRVVEEGTYTDLVARGGEFHRMARPQVLETTEVSEVDAV